MANTLTEVAHPSDVTYNYRRRQVINDLLKMKKRDVGDLFAYMANSPERIKDASGMTQRIMGEIHNLPGLPEKIKGILDSTSGTTGNVLIRQDLEPLIYRLFVEEFPAWDIITKAPSNGWSWN